MTKPTNINILGTNYKILYFQNMLDVCPYKQEKLWGFIDYAHTQIRIYDNGQDIGQIYKTLWHEILHGIANDLNLDINKEENHNQLDTLAMAIADTLMRNDFLVVKNELVYGIVEVHQ